jgi:CubicO group peptidase (beta-lactamase class C family)
MYLPTWKSARVLESVDTATGAYSTRAGRGPITIEHLLTHTSGIGYS